MHIWSWRLFGRQWNLWNRLIRWCGYGLGENLRPLTYSPVIALELLLRDLSLSTGMELFPCSFCEIKKETAWRHGDYNGGATTLSSNNYLPQDIVEPVVSVAFWTLHEPCDRLSASCLSRKSSNSTSALVHRKQLNEVEYVTSGLGRTSRKWRWSPVWKNLGHQRESFLQSTVQGLKCESAAAWFLETQTKCFQEALANFSRVPKHFSGRNFCGPSQNVVLGLNSVSTTPLLA